MEFIYFLNLIAVIYSSILLLFASVFAGECLIGCLMNYDRKLINKSFVQPVTTIIIPAYNEADNIGRTIKSVKSQLINHDQLLVVADNCSDNTFSISRKYGANVIERKDLENIGKGFAIAAGIDYLRNSPPDVVIFIDADCIIEQDFINFLSMRVVTENAPIQAAYLVTCESHGIKRMQISQFAWYIKNFLRPRGLMKLGFPCQLMGNGMAFPWQLIEKVPLGTNNIVEDLQLGIDMAMKGHHPIFCPEAVTTSTLPRKQSAHDIQHKRWEHGHIYTIFCQAPRMFLKSAMSLDYMLLIMALDLCVPPLSFLVVLISISLIPSIFVLLYTGSLVPVILSIAAFIFIGASALLCWAKCCRNIISLKTLFFIPVYIFMKLPIYASYLWSKQKVWVRTDRTTNRES